MLKNDVEKKMVVMEDGGVAEVFMYGIFGQSEEWMSASEAEKYMSDMDFLVTLRTLAKTNKRINIRLNSPGGSMKHGLGMITAVKTCADCELHCYVDGIAASMAADFFLSFKKENRHMASNSVLMIHAPIEGVWGNAKAHEECATKLKQLAEPTITILAEATGKTEEDIRTEFYDYTDHYLTAKECVNMGIVDGIETYEAASVVADPKKLGYTDLISLFKANNIQKVLSNQNPEADMQTVEDVKKAVAEGKLDKAALLTALDATEKVAETIPAPNVTPAAPSVDVAKIVEDAVQKAMKVVQDENATLKADIETLKQRRQGPSLGYSENDRMGDGEIEDVKKIFEDRQNALAKETTPFSTAD